MARHSRFSRFAPGRGGFGAAIPQHVMGPPGFPPAFPDYDPLPGPGGGGGDPVDFLEETAPETLFQSRVNELNLPFAQSQRIKRLFSSVYDQFLGLQGSQARGGNLPTARFEDFLSGAFSDTSDAHLWLRNNGSRAAHKSSRSSRRYWRNLHPARLYRRWRKRRRRIR